MEKINIYLSLQPQITPNPETIIKKTMIVVQENGVKRTSNLIISVCQFQMLSSQP